MPPRAAITIRGLSPDTKAKLRLRAARNQRSMEAEARAILEAGVEDGPQPGKSLADVAREIVSEFGPFDIELPPRDRTAWEPPDLSGLLDEGPDRKR
jgi:plasmid stability protein